MFRSFFIGGFEGSTGWNQHGHWFDQIVATGHDRTVAGDYRDLAALGIRTARDSARWPLIDDGRGAFDFSSLEPFVEAARRAGVEVIWDLFHYGYPADLDPFGEAFQRRFTDYCHAVGRYIGARTEGTVWFTPVNEPSFLSYAAGDTALFAPHATGRGPELKIALCRAAIAGIDALRDAAPGCRIVNVDPLCRVVASPERPHEEAEAHVFNERLVFESWDIIAGRLHPELGGSPSHLDVVGINYYWTNQWEWRTAPLADGRVPPLADGDPRRLPLSALVRSVWERYGHDLIISETAHVGDNRGPWLREVAQEAELMLAAGIPLHGVCLYPILGMPEWHAPDIWTPMGLWDPVCHRERLHERLVCDDMLDALQGARRLETIARAGQRRRDLDAAGFPPRMRCIR